MIKKLTRLVLCLTLFTIFGVINAPRASAQTDPITVQPTAIYRFQISFWDGGHLLTHVFNEGAANGHTFDPFNHPTFNGLGIYRPPDGYTADPSTGLVRLHRWRVVQSGWRVYYYYSIYFAPHGSDYHYEGVAGWVFPPNQFSLFHPAFINPLPLHPLSIWYSTDLGFWYGYGIFPGNFVEQPPNRSGKEIYFPQGLIASLPSTCIDPQFQTPPPPGGVGCPYGMRFNPPPPPPPPPPPASCNVSTALKAKCGQLGGSWDDDTCSCQY
jgi:hypothetical protein